MRCCERRRGEPRLYSEIQVILEALCENCDFLMSTVSAPVREINVAHSPDSDDAFMFYGLATNKVRVPGLHFAHTLCDIETLNQQGAGRRLRRHGGLVSRISVYSGSAMRSCPVAAV